MTTSKKGGTKCVVVWAFTSIHLRMLLCVSVDSLLVTAISNVVAPG